MKQNYFSRLFILVIFCLTGFYSEAQVTTATLSGTVKSKDGTPLSGATVKIIFADAGINKTFLSKSDGSFVVPNLRVGGPYSVLVSFTGFNPVTESNISLELGRNTDVALIMEPNTVSLSNVTITAKSKIFDNQRTGPSTNISSSE